MQKESDSVGQGVESSGASAEDSKEAVATETTEVVEAKPEKGLSLRDALEVAIEATKPESKADNERLGQAREGRAGQNKGEARKGTNATRENAGGERHKAKDAAPAPSSLEPPAEWDKDAKEDFRQSSPKAQEAALRLHRNRQSVVEEIRAGKEQLARESAELQWAKDVVKEITPFLKTRGDKEPTHAQVIKALRVVNEIDANAKGAVAEILKAKGIPVPKELENAGVSSPDIDEKIIPLQNKLKEVQSELAERKRAEQSQFLGQAWQAFEGTKNAAGTQRFPDCGNSESGIKIASSMGSLVRGDTDLSKQFIANVKARIPDLTYHKLLEEAYRYCGGKVDDSEASRTQDTQKHVLKSSRAASSVPGRGAPTSSSGPVKKFKTYREAARAALDSLESE
jgi:hypothetical protein